MEKDECVGNVPDATSFVMGPWLYVSSSPPATADTAEVLSPPSPPATADELSPPLPLGTPVVSGTGHLGRFSRRWSVSWCGGRGGRANMAMISTTHHGSLDCTVNPGIVLESAGVPLAGGRLNAADMRSPRQ